MTIDIILTARDIDAEKVKNKTVIVIDVLRATSVMTMALANGAHQVIPVLSPEEAFALQKKIGSEKVVLGGERNEVPIEGFDVGNSPLSYPPEVIKGKTLLITTSNGTRAIAHSKEAQKMLIGCFLNDKAIIDAVQHEEELILVASGSDDLFTLEDSLCAGKIAYVLQQRCNAQLSDVAIAMAKLYEQNQNDIHALLSKGRHYNRLKELGASDDLTYCLASDQTKVIPIYTQEGTFVRL